MKLLLLSELITNDLFLSLDRVEQPVVVDTKLLQSSFDFIAASSTEYKFTLALLEELTAIAL